MFRMTRATRVLATMRVISYSYGNRALARDGPGVKDVRKTYCHPALTSAIMRVGWRSLCVVKLEISTEIAKSDVWIFLAYASNAAHRTQHSIASKPETGKALSKRTEVAHGEDTVERCGGLQELQDDPGPQLEQASNGRPVLVVKGRQRFVVLDADSYDDIVERLEQLEQLQRGREPMQASTPTQRTGTEG